MNLITLVLWIITINKSNTFYNYDEESINYSNETRAFKTISIDSIKLSDLPESFDARIKWSNCASIGKIENQGECQSGWAVTVASVITDRMCIHNGKQDEDLSAYHLLSCCENCCGCRGGNILNAWKYVKAEGLLTGGSYNSKEGCQPYMIRPCDGRYRKYDECGWRSEVVPKCIWNMCTNKLNARNKYFGEKYRINNYVLLPRANPDLIMKELYLNGPIQISMHFYDDLRWYEKGIYVHKSGHFVGDHAVKLIGWDDQKNWLLINSFGKKWGNEGTFLMPRNHVNSNCDFGYAIVVPEFKTTKSYSSKAVLYKIDHKLYILLYILNVFVNFY